MLTKKKKTIMTRLLREATKNKPVFRARVVAAVVYRGKIIAIGKNQNKTHPEAAKYCKHEDAIFLHAEVDAINRAKKKMPCLSKTQIFVLRIRQDGTVGNSLPCLGCASCIEEHKVSQINYTNEEGELECI